MTQGRFRYLSGFDPAGIAPDPCGANLGQSGGHLTAASLDITVDLWMWDLDVDEAELGLCKSHLNKAEIARSTRYVNQRLTDRFCVARGRMRRVLATYTGSPPEALDFATNKQGKPRLASGPHFNLSHSQGTAALAVCADHAVGVDIEYWRMVEEGVAHRFFSPAEISELSTLPAGGFEQGFFRCWSRKEAVIKAVGLGISMPLDSFDVTLSDGDNARLTRIEGTGSQARDWHLQDLALQGRISGALAMQNHGRPVQITQRKLSDIQA